MMWTLVALVAVAILLEFVLCRARNAREVRRRRAARLARLTPLSSQDIDLMWSPGEWGDGDDAA